MRILLVVTALVLAGGFAAVAAPTAVACSGYSLCEIMNDAKCTLRETTQALYACYYYVGPPP